MPAISSFFLWLPWRLLKWLFSIGSFFVRGIRLALEALKPRKIYDPDGNNKLENISTCGSTVASGASKQRSLLRKSGDGSTVSCNSRVMFIEHSNGSVRTENYYYNPQEQPNAPFSATTSQTPEKSLTSTPQPKQKTLHRMPTPPHRLPRQVVLKSRVSESGDKENYSNMSDEAPRTHAVLATQRRLSKAVPLFTDQRNFDVSARSVSLSEQMRKRRLEGEGLSLVLQKKARPSNGRVLLGYSRPRLVSARTVLTKREREAREERIINDMNLKRAKVNEPALVPKVSGTDTPTLKPALQIPESSSETGKVDEPTAKPAPPFQFGGGTVPKNPSTNPATAGDLLTYPISFRNAESSSTAQPEGDEGPSFQTNPPVQTERSAETHKVNDKPGKPISFENSTGAAASAALSQNDRPGTPGISPEASSAEASLGSGTTAAPNAPQTFVPPSGFSNGISQPAGFSSAIPSASAIPSFGGNTPAVFGSQPVAALQPSAGGASARRRMLKQKSRR